MILSTQTCVIAHRFGIEQAIEILSNAGFDALDYSLFSEALHSGMGEPDHPHIPDAFMPKAARFLHDIGRHLIQMIEDTSKT
jgi:hypothetical protein